MKLKHHRAFDKRGLLAMRADFWGLFFDVEEPGDDFELRGTTAVVTIEGPLTHRAEWFWDSYESIRERVTAALESSASTVVLRIDSPGGDVAGCFETARELRALAASKGKRIVAYADGMAASAGYALACAAAEIYLPATGFVGSIGVISTLVDVVELDRKIGLNYAVVASGARKRYGHPNVPISDAAIANTQAQVDSLADLFFDLVSEARGLPASALSALEAGMLIGEQAVVAKLANGVCTFDELLERISSGNTTTPSGGAAEAGMGWKDEMKKAAEDGDEEAKKCLESLDGGGDEEPPKSKKEGAEEPKEEEEPPKSKKEGAEEPKDGEQAAAARTRHAPGASLEARLSRMEQDQERDRLLASRPDLMRDPALRKRLAAAPIDAVRWTVANLPRVAAAQKAPTSATTTSPIAHAGATTPGVTRSSGEGGSPLGITRRSGRADELDAALGFAAGRDPIVHNRNETSIRLMTPSQARDHVKRLEGRKAEALKSAQTSGGK